MVKPGDVCQLTFDEEDYPTKEILWGKPDLVQEVYQDQHLIVVNKPEGMKTHGNQPDEIALLNHVSAYVGQNLLCRSSPRYGNKRFSAFR